jgi:hypothetical protein
VRAATEGQKGIHIVTISRSDENRLLRFIRERERLAMRLRKGR